LGGDKMKCPKCGYDFGEGYIFKPESTVDRYKREVREKYGFRGTGD